MARLRGASLARCSSLLTTRPSGPVKSLRSATQWDWQRHRWFCSHSPKQTTPNISALYKALTKPFPSEAPDPKLTSLLESAQSSDDAHAAIKALTSNAATIAIHPTHVLTAVELCLPGKPQLAESLLATLEDSVPRYTLTPGRAFLARHYTSRNDARMALATMRFPMKLLSKTAHNLHTQFDYGYLGRSTAAWGVIIKSLTQLKHASHACTIADMGMRGGVPVSDGYLHLCIDALRMDKRWEQANSLFERVTSSGVAASERTVGSLLLALSCRSARAQVDRKRVIQVVDMIESPSVRFLQVALMGLTSVGAISRAERVFMELVSDGIVEEDMFEMIMAGLGNFVELLAMAEVDRIDSCTYAGISERGDQIWKEYLRRFARGRKASSVLSKLLRVKTRCFRNEEGVEILEQLVCEGRSDIVRSSHITMILGAVELSCDVGQMKRLLKMMERLEMKHDMRSLAFCVGSLIGDGNLTEAVAMIRRDANEAIANVGESGEMYHSIVLLRRLKTVLQALKDGGVPPLTDILRIVALVEQKKDQVAGKP